MMCDLPKRVPGATMAWPTDDPDVFVFGRYLGENNNREDSPAVALLHRVLDGLHRFSTDPGSTPVISRPSSWKQVLVMPEKPEGGGDAEIAARVAAVLATLQCARERRGWTSDELAARTGSITAERMAALENGTKEPRFSDLFQICAALGLDPAEVVAGAQRRRGGS
jgi:DNA-binding Xre family transcriptional regulator